MPFEKISQQLSVLSYLMRDTRESVHRTETAVHQTSGKVDALTDRVDRIEDREHRKQRTNSEWTARDYIMATLGASALALAAFGKIPWSVVELLASKLK